MKNIIFILFILIGFQSCFKKNNEKKTTSYLNFSGDYIGTFTDIRNASGSIQLTIYQSKSGLTGGIIHLKKDNETDITTGVVNISSDGEIITGNLIPSVIKYPKIDSEKKSTIAFCNSYTCSWSFFGEISSTNKITITGKATPMNCSESNIMNFKIVKSK